jgi:hypothetical protein
MFDAHKTGFCYVKRSQATSILKWGLRSIPELFSCEAKFSQWSKKFPALDRMRIIFRNREIPPLDLAWARWIRFIMLHPISWRSIAILSCHLHLDLPNVLFLFRFDTSNILYIPHVSCVLHISPSQLYIDFIIVIALTFGGESKLQNCRVC